MEVVTSHIDINTQGLFDAVDITDSLQQRLRMALFREGTLVVFSNSSDAGFMSVESGTNVLEQFNYINEQPLDKNDDFRKIYLSNAIAESSLTIPFKKANLLLGTKQRIVFVEFDKEPHQRQVITQFLGS